MKEKSITISITDTSFNIDFSDEYSNIKVAGTGDLILTADPETIQKVTQWFHAITEEEAKA